MWRSSAALEESGPRLLHAVVAGFAALFAAALFLGVFDGGLPTKPARAEAAPPALAGGGGPARPSIQRLCFHGPGGELLDFAPRQQCP
jgi:hypothetical protein